jgi:hypothetical protein
MRQYAKLFGIPWRQLCPVYKTVRKPIVLTIPPTSRGFGYAVFCNEPVDWGAKEARKYKNRRCLLAIKTMLQEIKPDIVVVEDESHPSCLRGLRTRTLLSKSRVIIEQSGARLAQYSRQQVYRTFGVCRVSNDNIAVMIAETYPELRHRLPKRRRIWESKQHSMAIFEAMMLVMTHCKAQKKQMRTQYSANSEK